MSTQMQLYLSEPLPLYIPLQLTASCTTITLTGSYCMDGFPLAIVYFILTMLLLTVSLVDMYMYRAGARGCNYSSGLSVSWVVTLQALYLSYLLPFPGSFTLTSLTVTLSIGIPYYNSNGLCIPLALYTMYLLTPVYLTTSLYSQNMHSRHRHCYIIINHTPRGLTAITGTGNDTCNSGSALIILTNLYVIYFIIVYI